MVIKFFLFIVSNQKSVFYNYNNKDLFLNPNFDDCAFLKAVLDYFFNGQHIFHCQMTLMIVVSKYMYLSPIKGFF